MKCYEYTKSDEKGFSESNDLLKKTEPNNKYPKRSHKR
jgi:hypothetical protein